MNIGQIKKNCIYAALMGDSLGVLHEFRPSSQINSKFIKNPSIAPYHYTTYDVPVGTISDDGSQILMVNEVVNANGKLNYRDELIAWSNGKYWNHNHIFDMGIQTRKAINCLKEHKFINDPNGSGNGSLMRMIPLSFDSYESIGANARMVSIYTHNSDDALKSCEFYCKLVHSVAYHKFREYQEDARDLFKYYWSSISDEMKWKIPADNVPFKGTGFVIDSIRLIKHCIELSESFTEAITMCIQYGGDTDTNAAILAPVAYLVFGMDDVSEEWHEMMEVNLCNPFYKKFMQSGEQVC